MGQRSMSVPALSGRPKEHHVCREAGRKKNAKAAALDYRASECRACGVLL